MLAEFLQVAGLAAVAVGAGLIFLPLGVIAAGVALVVVGMSLERE